MEYENVLLVSYYYPPLNRVASYRLWHWANFLSDNSYQVSVYTTQKSESDGPLEDFKSKATVIEYQSILSKALNSLKLTKRKRVDKASRKANRFLWAFVGPVFRLRLARKTDVIIMSYGPVESVIAGCLFKAINSKALLIMDYRDPWTGNPYKTSGILDRFLEKIALKMSDSVVTVSAGMSGLISKDFHREYIYTVYNGFIGDFQVDLATRPRLEHPIRILHAGTIYKGMRDPAPLFRVLKNICDEGVDLKGKIEVIFIGDRTANVSALAEEFAVSELVKTPGQVSKAESEKLQSEVDLLLLLSSSDAVSDTIVPAKVFEYITSGTPVLGIGFPTSSELGSILDESGCGLVCNQNEDLIYELLTNYLKLEKPNWFTPQLDAISRYSRSHQAKFLLEALRSK